MIILCDMTKKEYNQYIEQAIIDYAKDKVESKTWKQEESLEMSKKSYEKLLPNGIDTTYEYLYSVRKEDKLVGYLWLHCKEEVAFIYDVLIHENYRGLGYGKDTMKVALEKAKELGASRVELHVFGHNKRALHVYQQVGFEITDYSMGIDI